MKVLCASLPGAGHAHPMLAVARALAARGHRVTIATGPEHVEDAARAGASFEPLPIVAGSTSEHLLPYEDSERLARAFAPVVARHDPDVMVVDLLTLGAALAAEMNGVPYASLLIHPLHLPSRDLPPFGFGAPPGRGLGRLRDAWMRRANAKELAAARDGLNAARAALGLAPTARLDAQLSPDLLLVATLPALEIPRSDWPERAYVIGPCLWDAAGDPPDLPSGDEPLVLIAASTAHPDERLLRAGLDAVAQIGVRALVTVGKSAMPDALPDRIRAVGFVSHDAVLPRCAAVVCNGGHGIVARALVHGVPVIVVPGHGDQRENGYRVQRARAGLRVLRANDLARALERVLKDPTFAERARAIATESADLDGPARAADLVEALAGTSGYPVDVENS